jgi:hypothetical protein
LQQGLTTGRMAGKPLVRLFFKSIGIRTNEL